MMNSKHNYEEPKIEVVRLYTSDVITVSSPTSSFDGEDDNISDWGT